ncbi:MAG: hypothetical protein V1909_03555 [Candidatus Micrarchaeota archaeon]
MADDSIELEKSIILTALGEEFLMIDTYSQVREVCHNQKVMGILEILIRESQGHASMVSGIILELASGYSLPLDDVDKTVVELSAKSPQFKLTNEASEWYKNRVSGIMDVTQEEDLFDAHESTNKVTIQALEVFEGSEKNAYTLYHALSEMHKSKVHKATFAKIASDELRHEKMLEALVISLKSGDYNLRNQGEGEQETTEQTTLGLFYCVACLKIHKGDAESCGACGSDLKKL